MKTKTIYSGTKPTTRRPRLRRAESNHLPPLRRTIRDGNITYDVYDYRALSSRQIEVLHFGGSLASEAPVKSQARYRLQLLFQHGILQRHAQAQLPGLGMLPFVYTLDRKGAVLVAERLGCAVSELDWEPKDNQLGQQFLEHLLATNDVRIAINLSAKKHGYIIPTWLDDKTLRSKQMKDYVVIKGPEGAERKVAIVPDGYFMLNIGEREAHLFVEIDLGTVTGESSTWGRRDMARKITSYLAYHHSGQFAARYGSRSMRVLTVTTSDTRLQNLKEITEKANGKSRFWLTTFERVKTSDVLTDPIWAVAEREGLFSLVETE